jgi:hypothetical protein
MPNLMKHRRKSRNDWENSITDRMIKERDQAELRRAKEAGEVPDTSGMRDFFKVVPNRLTLRKSGLNTVRSTGKGHARCSRAKKTPASLYTLVAIHQRMPNGTIRKLIVPRSSIEGK